mmetsp:Transcript_17535/g.36820  ORF Transcript_17535/g.36820 Transcript_17535/m.36820 type:complete len:144 (-) Transcript_17535:94-525(-)
MKKPRHGTAFTPEQIQDDVAVDSVSRSNEISSTANGTIQISDLFVTMCFFARLGFTQPPTCLKCAYRGAGCGASKVSADGERKRSCHELVPWRRDANIPLHPDKLIDNVVFVTCETASSLVNGDAYPSIRWDSKSKKLLLKSD